jgi:hypothetical protein
LCSNIWVEDFFPFLFQIHDRGLTGNQDEPWRFVVRHLPKKRHELHGRGSAVLLLDACKGLHHASGT